MVYSDTAQSYFDEFPFRRKDLRKPSTGYYFLSHAHSDHTSGIKGILSDPDATLVCSPETAAVIKVLHNIPIEKCLIVTPSQSLNFDKFIVHALDANHCVGSLMFVIESIRGRKEVYSGDFRLGPPINQELSLIQNSDHMWLDFTYGKRSIFQFPSREELISEIITFILSEGNFPEKDIWISAYQIGKELLFKTISEALKIKIWAPDQKVEIYKEIGGKWDIFTDDPDSIVRVGSRRMVEDMHGITAHERAKMSNALRISPTGWAIRLRDKRLDVNFFPYSDHCSYSELHEFIKIAKAKSMTKI